MTENRKNGRNTDGKFSAGNPGRPRGALNKTTLAVQALLDGQAERITNALIDAALVGEPSALKLCMERLLPARRSRPVNFDLGATDTPEGCGKAMDDILHAVARGEIAPDEGKTLLELLEGRRGALPAVETGAETGGGLLADLAKLVRGDLGGG